MNDLSTFINNSQAQVKCRTCLELSSNACPCCFKQTAQRQSLRTTTQSYQIKPKVIKVYIKSLVGELIQNLDVVYVQPHYTLRYFHFMVCSKDVNYSDKLFYVPMDDHLVHLSLKLKSTERYSKNFDPGTLSFNDFVYFGHVKRLIFFCFPKVFNSKTVCNFVKSFYVRNFGLQKQIKIKDATSLMKVEETENETQKMILKSFNS